MSIKDGTIQFSSDREWIMKLEQIGDKVRVLFNRDAYPEAAENDFAEAVMKILELNFIKMPPDSKLDATQANIQ